MHSCEGQNESALIAHAWRFDDVLDAWVRDDCVERGVAYAAVIHREGERYQGPHTDTPAALYERLEDAKTAHDISLMKRGWSLIDGPQ
jgi:hypothetical protein